MIFYLFRKYPDKRFVIIADYKKDVLRKYLAVFSDVKYRVVDAAGTRTCSGVSQAVELIPDGYEDEKKVSLDNQNGIGDISEGTTKDYIGISGTFPCRLKYSYKGACG